MSSTDQHLRILSHAADTVSAFAIVGTIAGYLPPLAALVATVWYMVQIWESKTAAGWRARWHRGKAKV
jgi:hypothetical protein